MDVVIDIVILALLLARQVTTRPLSDSYRLPAILVIIGLVEFAAFLMGGGKQFAEILKGQRAFTTIHDGKTVAVALVGSLALAALFAAIRAPTFRLWWQDGKCWRKGSALTLVRGSSRWAPTSPTTTSLPRTRRSTGWATPPSCCTSPSPSGFSACSSPAGRRTSTRAMARRTPKERERHRDQDFHQSGPAPLGGLEG